LEERSEGNVRQVSSRSVGVEEEFLLVEPETGQPRAVAETVLAAAQQAGADGHDGDGAALEFELKQQ
jgi:carboxylate-amine ligase